MENSRTRSKEKDADDSPHERGKEGRGGYEHREYKASDKVIPAETRTDGEVAMTRDIKEMHRQNSVYLNKIIEQNEKIISLLEDNPR